MFWVDSQASRALNFPDALLTTGAARVWRQPVSAHMPSASPARTFAFARFLTTLRRSIRAQSGSDIAAQQSFVILRALGAQSWFWRRPQASDPGINPRAFASTNSDSGRGLVRTASGSDELEHPGVRRGQSGSRTCTVSFPDCGRCTHVRARYERRAVRSDRVFVP